MGKEGQHIRCFVSLTTVLWEPQTCFVRRLTPQWNSWTPMVVRDTLLTIETPVTQELPQDTCRCNLSVTVPLSLPSIVTVETSFVCPTKTEMSDSTSSRSLPSHLRRLCPNKTVSTPEDPHVTSCLDVFSLLRSDTWDVSELKTRVRQFTMSTSNQRRMGL